MPPYTVKVVSEKDFADIYAVCNDAARAYHGVIADDQWKDPYMPEAELRAEIEGGVRFFGAFDEDALVAVMGLQDAGDVALIRHAYTRTARQGCGAGSALLEHIRSLTQPPILIGTWRAAAWAVGFYRRHAFRQDRVASEETETALSRARSS